MTACRGMFHVKHPPAFLPTPVFHVKHWCFFFAKIVTRR